jgi:hypothetical protein
MRIVTCFEALGKTEKNTKKHVGAASMTLDDVEKKRVCFNIRGKSLVIILPTPHSPERADTNLVVSNSHTTSQI